MPYKLISLVFLLFFLIINKAYSVDEFILPVKKPSIFKKIEKNITSKKESNLPQKKPIIQTNTSEENIVNNNWYTYVIINFFIMFIQTLLRWLIVIWCNHK